MNSKTTKFPWKTGLALLLTLAFLGAGVFGLNWILQDQFHQNQLKAQKQIPRQVLPDGDTFELYQGTLAYEVTECFVAQNGAGIAVVCNRSISHGEIHVMVGVNGEGLISAVSIPFQEYTEGSDAKVAEDAFLSIFVGRSVLSGTTIEEDYELDPVPGAEEASDAVYQSVKAALRQYMMMENIEKNDQTQEKEETK